MLIKDIHNDASIKELIKDAEYRANITREVFCICKDNKNKLYVVLYSEAKDLILETIRPV